MFFASAVTRSTLTAGAQLDLVPGHGRAAAEAGDLRVDVELVEDAGERLDDAVVRRAARLGRRAGGQEVGRRQRVGDVAGERELLHALRELVGRRRLRRGRRRQRDLGLRRPDRRDRVPAGGRGGHARGGLGVRLGDAVRRGVRALRACLRPLAPACRAARCRRRRAARSGTPRRRPASPVGVRAGDGGGAGARTAARPSPSARGAVGALADVAGQPVVDARAPAAGSRAPASR